MRTRITTAERPPCEVCAGEATHYVNDGAFCPDHAADLPENPVLARDLQSDLVAVEQMSPADLRRLAESLGRYDVVTVVVSARLAPLAFAARSDA